MSSNTDEYTKSKQQMKRKNYKHQRAYDNDIFYFDNDEFIELMKEYFKESEAK